MSFAGVDIPCTVVNGAITNNPRNGWSTDCATQPTIQRIVFLKASLCTANSISMPTTTSAIDTSSCTTIWENLSGESVDIQLGIEHALSKSDNDVWIPKSGTYRIVYLEMKPYFGVSVSKKFAQGMIDTSGNNIASGRIFCKSLDISVQNYRDTTPVATFCSPTQGTPGITTAHFNSLGDNGGVPTPTYVDGNLSAALITADRKLIPTPTLNTAGSEDKLVAWFVQNTVITNRTTGFAVGFGNARGASVGLENFKVISYSPGPFNITLTPK